MESVAGNAALHAVHVGRQPIYDGSGQVVAFELLFRDGSGALSATRDDSAATAQVIINTFGEFGLADIVGPHACFVNLTRDFIVGTLPLPFGPERVVVEVLETVDVDDDVLAGIQRLAADGYAVALDDYVNGSSQSRLLEYAAVVKLDLLGTSEDDLRAIVRTCRRYPRITLLGERLETPEDVQLARTLGCQLFQGYALGRPTVRSAAALTPARMRQLELLTMLAKGDVDIAEIAGRVSADPVLSLRLLRISNSAGSGLARQVSSVHEAVMLLGLRRIRDWVSVMLIGDVTGTADEARLATAVARARMCQEVAEQGGIAGPAAFTAGLLRGIADLLGTPVRDLLAGLPVSPELTAALVDGDGRLGEVLQAVAAYERADLVSAAESGLAPDVFSQAYLSATGWSMRTLAALRD
jgi:EAL and modified HD-GYP domain-containing signal transduction protein